MHRSCKSTSVTPDTTVFCVDSERINPSSPPWRIASSVHVPNSNLKSKNVYIKWFSLKNGMVVLRLATSHHYEKITCTFAKQLGWAFVSPCHPSAHEPPAKSESSKRRNNRCFTSVQNFHTQAHPCTTVFSCWVPDGPIWNCQLVTRQSHCSRYPAFDQSVFLCPKRSFLLVYPDANFMPKIRAMTM